MNNFGIHEGMSVFSRDRRDVGRVQVWGGDRFLVRKGFVFRRNYNLGFDQVDNVLGEKVHLRQTLIELDAERETSNAEPLA